MAITIHLEHDNQDPTEGWDGQWTLYSFNTRHGNFKHPAQLGLGPLDAYGEPIIRNIGLRRKLAVGLAHIVSCYEHSGICWGLRGEVMQCPWDTTRIAGLLVWEHKPDEMGAKTYEARADDARAFLRTYNAVSDGAVYYFCVEDAEGNHLESCGGFIDTGEPDDLDDMFQEIRDAIPDGTADDEIEWTGDAAWLHEYHELPAAEVSETRVARRAARRTRPGSEGMLRRGE